MDIETAQTGPEYADSAAEELAAHLTAAEIDTAKRDAYRGSGWARPLTVGDLKAAPKT